MSKCVDESALDLVHRVARSLEGLCNSAVVIITTKCPQEGHGVHTSCALCNDGIRTARDTRNLVRKLRGLADELEKTIPKSVVEN